MDSKSWVLLALSIILLIFALYYPWMKADKAREALVEQFNAKWQGVQDGCGINCKGCGPQEALKVLGGYKIRLEYACGILPEDKPEYHKNATVFVSFLGSASGIPKS